MKFWWWLLLLPSVALASTENWPQLYNTGVTAYESNDFARAAQLFENATSSQDRLLQQRALYNLGNTDYRLGQTQPKQAQQLWQRAMKSYETALAIDPNDADAKFNHEFVKKKLEELKQQQQQQQQNQKNQQNKNQNQKKDQQQQQQQQQSQDKQSEQQQQQQSQQEQDKQQSQQSQEQQKKEQQQAPEQKQKDQQQSEGQQAKQDKQPQGSDGQPEGAEKMQATEMLDNLREDERNWNFFPELQMKDLKDSGPPAKDW
jgi:Ca-activated chloride channel homolog